MSSLSPVGHSIELAMVIAADGIVLEIFQKLHVRKFLDNAAGLSIAPRWESKNLHTKNLSESH